MCSPRTTQCPYVGHCGKRPSGARSGLKWLGLRDSRGQLRRHRVFAERKDGLQQDSAAWQRALCHNANYICLHITFEGNPAPAQHLQSGSTTFHATHLLASYKMCSPQSMPHQARLQTRSLNLPPPEWNPPTREDPLLRYGCLQPAIALAVAQPSAPTLNKCNTRNVGTSLGEVSRTRQAPSTVPACTATVSEGEPYLTNATVQSDTNYESNTKISQQQTGGPPGHTCHLSATQRGNSCTF
jgi:hypothetical protein